MTRYLHCKTCSIKWGQHPEDKARGITMRKVFVVIKTPKDHGVTIKTEKGLSFCPMEQIDCDSCGTSIPDGTVMIATTYTRPEEDPVYWESQFGTVLSDEVAKAEEILTKP